MFKVAPHHREQIREAEELLGAQIKASYAGELFEGRIYPEIGFSYPAMGPSEVDQLSVFLPKVRSFLAEKVNSVEIDRKGQIPAEIIKELFDLGVMSMSIPKEYGGLGFSQVAYCKVLELIGSQDASLAILINAHQSIGIRSLILFGTSEQKARWLPLLVKGGMLAAFGLTEPNAGSDAGGIQTRAVLNPDNKSFSLNGRKRWITNGAIAGLITVMAKIPNTQDVKGREKITAFLVSPTMQGFEVEASDEAKCGIRGTTTTKLKFNNIQVPRENVIGPEGKGLKVALTVLDFGRTTFGASCTGVAKRCVKDAIEHSKTRVQFGKPLCHFELVKKKLAHIASLSYAMEAATYFTAQLIDRNREEFMLETAILKVFSSEGLWDVVNETIQIMGGKAYFKDQPYERMMRDARINMIGEGANDVLRTFIALGGIRTIGQDLKNIQDSIRSPFKGAKGISESLSRMLGFKGQSPVVPQNQTLLQLSNDLQQLATLFGKRVRIELLRHRESILDKQYIQKRMADIAIDLYVSCAVISRLDAALLSDQKTKEMLVEEELTGTYFCKMAARRIRANLDEFGTHFDSETTCLADLLTGT